MCSTDPADEAEHVRREIARSVEIGTITDELTVLVHQMCRRRVGVGWAEDIAQHVLLCLLRNLQRINLARDTSAYVGNAIVKTWRQWCRNRRTEQRYLLYAAGELVDQFPPASRPRLRRRLIASGLRKFKYF